ncbi:flagellar biosynthesis protein FliZ [Robertmurraya yapensis]|uniref:Flagellar biosynthesis protein FliZ n=2 Tax=Bacillus yapensis TaxID=2492960 RepID=A0A3S0LHW2_9BACI|nr:flagellar biosynthesis protein FliZ [Bacillus yapensis]TKS98672.1 flagellar biosynthesis protein FliZ [Bacillus yapensis]
MLLLFVVLLSTDIKVYAEPEDSVKELFEKPKDENTETKQTPEKEAEDITVQENTTVGITAWDIIKMIFATIFVIALLYFLLKYINKKSHGYKDSQLIQNIGGAPLGANRSVQMIKVGERVLVVGVGENIQLLKEIEDEAEVRQIIEDYNNKMEQLISPSDIVTKVLQRTKTLNVFEKEKENTSFSSVLKSQLDKISKDRKKLYDEMEKKGSDER